MTNLNYSARDLSTTECVTKTEDNKEIQKENKSLTFEKDLENKKTNGISKLIHYWLKEVHWPRAIAISSYFLLGFYLLLTFPYIQRFKTLIFVYIVANFSIFGITGGVHRLWSHKSYEAKLPLRIILAFAYISSSQIPFKMWIQLHRIHHKYTDTDADPHNAARGFFFSHVGWMMNKRRPAVREKMKQIDMTDIEADPVIRFCDKHFLKLVLLTWLFWVAIPVYMWNEDWYYSFAANFLKFMWVLNLSYSINSFSHLIGYKPFDKSLSAVENVPMAYLALGEGWHNYHHVFPFDYRTPDIFGSRFDFTGTVLDFFGKIGWAYNFKTVKMSLVEKIMRNKGDGTYMKMMAT